MIYLDNSIISTFRDCQEKAHLKYVEDIQPIISAPPLDFGSAFHKAIQAFYVTLAKNPTNLDKDSLRPFAISEAKKAFVAHLKSINSSLPIEIESEQKRSIERGLYLLEGYFHKWRGETVINEIRPDTNEPYVEIGFALYLMDWKSEPVMIVGTIDRIMRSRTDNRLRNWETKTTTQGLTQYVNQVRPNHQITTYQWACQELLKMDVAGTVWDCIFISSRQPKTKGDEWETRGIDMEKDFNRSETRRSKTDIEELLFDLTESVTEYLTLRDSGKKRWARNAPGACYKYGGCDYREICITNRNQQIIDNKYKREKWIPWKPVELPIIVSP